MLLRLSMTRAANPFVDLRAGEARPALRAFALLALVIGGHTLLETARDSLFLRKLPVDRLAIVYMVIAGLSLLVAGPNARAVRKVGEGRALLTTLTLGAAGTLVLYFQPATAVIAYALYIWSAFLSTIMVVQFWTFVAQDFTASQGKRLFGPIAAGGVIGAVVGAGSAAMALERISVRSLLLGATAAFVVAGILLGPAVLKSPLREKHPRGAEAQTSPVTEKQSRPPSGARSAASDGVRSKISVLVDRPYVGWLAALTALSTAAVLATDYLFKMDAARRIPPGELGKYLSRSYAAFNGVALVVQLFLAGPFVRRTGVSRALLLMPALLLGGAATALGAGSSTAVLFTKGVDGGLRHSLHRVTTELMGLPMAADLRARAKPVLDGALPRVVQAIMAGLLLLITALGLATTRTLAALIAVLAAAWLGVAIASRRPYLDAFRQALFKGSLETTEPIDLDLASIEVVLQMLSSREGSRVIAAMDLLVDSGRERFVPGLLLYHESEEVQIHALHHMGSAGRREWAPLAERLFEARSSEKVRIAAIRALSMTRTLSSASQGLVDESAAVRAHAAVALALADPKADPATSPTIRALLALKDARGYEARLALLDAIGDGGDQRMSGVLLEVLERPNTSSPIEYEEFIQRSVLAMARVRHALFIPVLVQRLRVRRGRNVVRDALVEMGEPAQEALEDAMKRPDTQDAVRIHLPRTISRFGNQRAADFLTSRLAVERIGLVRYKALRGLGRLLRSRDLQVNQKVILEQMMSNLADHLRHLATRIPLAREAAELGGRYGRFVLGLLEDKLRQSLERAFRLLQIAYRDEDMRGVYVTIKAQDKRIRANAAEFLDALTSQATEEEARRAHKLLRLVVDDLPDEEKVARAGAYVKDPPATYEASLLKLMQGHDGALALLASYHALELGREPLRETAQKALRYHLALAEVPGGEPPVYGAAFADGD